MKRAFKCGPDEKILGHQGVLFERHGLSFRCILVSFDVIVILPIICPLTYRALICKKYQNNPI